MPALISVVTVSTPVGKKSAKAAAGGFLPEGKWL